MNLTSKSRYALKIMMDMTHYKDQPLIRRGDIVKRQGIPADYLDQIMIRLRAKNLVASVRGRTGGYKLGKSAHEITLWDVFSAVEDGIYPVDCVSKGHSCDFESSCVSKDAWSEIFGAMKDPLLKMNLGDLSAKWANEHRMCPMGGTRECRSGSAVQHG